MSRSGESRLDGRDPRTWLGLRGGLRASPANRRSLRERSRRSDYSARPGRGRTRPSSSRGTSSCTEDELGSLGRHRKLRKGCPLDIGQMAVPGIVFVHQHLGAVAEYLKGRSRKCNAPSIPRLMVHRNHADHCHMPIGLSFLAARARRSRRRDRWWPGNSESRPEAERSVQRVPQESPRRLAILPAEEAMGQTGRR